MQATSTRSSTGVHSSTACADSAPPGPNENVGVPPRVNVAASCHESKPPGRPPPRPRSAAVASVQADERVVGGDLARHDVTVPEPAQRMIGEPGVGGDGTVDAVLNFALDAQAGAVLVDVLRQVHAARRRARTTPGW